jgi:hypothetical protein
LTLPRIEFRNADSLLLWVVVVVMRLRLVAAAAQC